MTDALKLLDETMAKLSAAESELETALESLNPVTQRSERAQVSAELANLRDGCRELERKRGRLAAKEASIDPDPEAIAELSTALATLGEVTGKGEKNQRIIAAAGTAVGAAKTVLGAI